jgi:hypothetical protein
MQITVDNKAPIMTLSGMKTITLFKGQTYIEAGATRIDDLDGTLTITQATNGAVNKNIP